MNLFHHLKSIGGNLYVEKQEFGMIQGVEENATCIMTPDLNVLLQIPHATAQGIPTTMQLLSVTSVQEVSNLTIGQTTSFKPRNFIPVPPFLIEPINNSISNSEGDSKVLIEVVRAIKDFDVIHTGDNEYQDKAKSKCKDILIWLYLVGSGKITPIPTIGCNSRQMIDSFKEIEEKELNLLLERQNANQGFNADDLERILKRPLEIMAASSCSTQNFMHKLTQIQDQNNDKSSKSFKKVAPTYQKMLLIASSQGEVVPVELNTEAMKFFSQSSVLNAQIFLNSFFKSGTN